MLTHPRFDVLRRYASEKVTTDPALARHLETCTRCREAVAWSRQVVADVRAETEISAPVSGWQGVAARVRADESVLLPTSSAAPRRRSTWSHGALKAAILVLALAGTAAAVVPGSPVRRWVAELLSPATEPALERLREPLAPPVGDDHDAARSTTVILPTGDAPLRVTLARPHASLRIRIRVGAPGELEVTATGAAADARFDRRQGGLTIAEAGPGEILLVLPQGAGRIRIEVDERPLVAKDGDRLVVLTAEADTIGSELWITVGRNHEGVNR